MLFLHTELYKMSVVKKIIHQSAIYFLGSVISVIVGFFFKIYLSKHLGSEGLGIYAFGMSIIGVLGVFLSFGYGNGLVRFVSKYLAINNYSSLFAYLSRSFFINLLISLPICGLFIFFPSFISEFILNKKSITPYIPLFGIMLFVNGFLVLADQTIRGLQEVKKSTIINTFLRLPVKIGLTVLLFSYGLNLKGYIIAETIGVLFAFVLLMWLVFRLLPIPFVFQLHSSTEEENKFRFNLLTTNIWMVLQRYGDKFLLVFLLNEAMLGIYSVVLTIAAFTPLVLTSLNSIFRPIISQLHSQNKKEELKIHFQRSCRYIFTFSFPLIAFLILFSESVMAVFGSDFVAGASLLVMVIIGELINLSMGPVGSMLQMCGQEKVLRNISILSSIITFILFYFFIKWYGILGLGLAYINGRLLINILSTYALYKKENIVFFHKDYLKTFMLFSVLFYFLFLTLNTTSIESPYYLVIALLSIYALFFFCWFLLIGRKEVDLIFNYFRLKK